MEIAEKANGTIQQPVSFSYIWGDALEELERVAPNLCAPGKGSVASAVARITGKAASALEPNFARIMCQGGWSKSVKRFRYEGVQDCRAAILAGGGDKACRYRCLGYGTCAKVCPVDAPSGEQKKKHSIDKGKCIGCGICTARCPVQAIDRTFNASEVFAAAEKKKKKAETA